jgi:hypothetical protein
MRIAELRVRDFKGFDRFSVTFPEHAYLVGPNSAGKSTLIEAIRAVARAVQIARTRKPDARREHGGWEGPAWSVTAEQLDLLSENIRHEFRDQEVVVEARFTNRHRLSIVAESDEGSPFGESQLFFYLELHERPPVTRPKDVLNRLPDFGIVPLLTPLPLDEDLKQANYVSANRGNRVSSLHFRNRLWMRWQEGASEWDEFAEFVHAATPELRFVKVGLRHTGAKPGLDVYVKEVASRTDRELCWIGDGMQIWLQILEHVYTYRDREVILLDEPDVFLHPDLQRRIVDLLSSVPAQTILATHSAELVAEADSANIVWVDRSRSRAIRNPSPELSGQLSAAIGSQFNLRLARALRSRVVVLVEGQDMVVLRRIASTLGCEGIASESHISVVPMGGFSRWPGVEPFAWIMKSFLDGAVPVYVLLDRDYRGDKEVASIEGQLRSAGVVAHIWSRKELENYLLGPALISRVTGIAEEDVRELLMRVTDHLEVHLQVRLSASREDFEIGPKADRRSIAEEAVSDFRSGWDSLEFRLRRLSGKDVLTALNRDLAANGREVWSSRGLAKEMRSDEVPQEMVDVLEGIERRIH